MELSQRLNKIASDFGLNGAQDALLAIAACVLLDRNNEVALDGRDLAGTIARLVAEGFTLPAGKSIGTDGEPYAGAHSFQPIGPDLVLDPDAGSTVDDPKFLAPVMGNVIGENMTKQGAYLAGLIGALSILGTKASHWPVTGLLGVIMDGVTDADGAVVAHLDGDSALTKANAAFKAMMKNSTPGSGFNYGMDLNCPAADGFPALKILKALTRSPNEVCQLEGDGAPVNGTTGAGFAGPGSQYVDYTNANLYINANTKASPTWKLVTRAA